MRPLYLEFRGIGPFVEKQSVDFSSFDDQALFLIHGPTGQGKTFIFDALCYALYADTPAGREDYLKSDYLSDGVDPYIDFKFSLGRDIYDVRRTLSFNRPRKRGGGVTVNPETQTLGKLNPDGLGNEILAVKKSDVNRRIKTILGLDSGQFRQVMMIPQGEFRDLLLADSGDRESLLEKLFDTAFYRRIQERLKEMEDESNLEENIFADQNLKLRNDLVDLWRSEELSPLLYEDGVLLIVEAEEELREKKAVLASAERKSVVIRDKTAEKVTKAVELDRYYKRLEELQHQQGHILLQEVSMSKLTEKLARDTRALSLKDRFFALNEARKYVKTAAVDLKEAMQHLEKVVWEKKNLDNRLQASSEQRKKLNLLLQCIPLLSGFRDGYQQRISIRKRMNEAQIRLESAEASCLKLKERAKALTQRNQEIAAILVELESRGARDVKQQTIHHLEELVNLRKSLEEHELQLGDVQEQQERSSVSLLNLKSRREANLAGELAVSLQDETPCPVCGSLTHPSPALQGEALASGEMEQAEKDFLACNSQTERIQTRIAGDREKIEELKAKVPDGDDSGRIRQLKDDIGKEQELIRERESLQGTESPRLSVESERLAVESKQDSRELEILKGQLEEIEKKWSETLSTLPSSGDEPLPTPENLPGLLGTWENEKSVLSELLAQLESDERGISDRIVEAEAKLVVRNGQQGKNLKNLSAKETAFFKDLRSAGFGDETELEKALHNAGTVEEDRLNLESWENHKKENTVIIKETLTLIDGRERPDLRTLEQEKKKTSELAGDAAGKLNAVLESLKKFQSLRDELETLEKNFRERSNMNAVIRQLSGQSRGSLPPKISLNRFFLSRRLEEVLVQATLRLSLLSQGRFILKRRDEGKTAAARAGLDLLVSDAWTGTERPVNTLSGGQLFMASLSLALGLADVVQARSGAVHMEALFIDEGFGTLDDEALQGVLRVLNDLRENRMVGVISHVPELKRQIADRIEVYRNDPGSSLRVTCRT